MTPEGEEGRNEFVFSNRILEEVTKGGKRGKRTLTHFKSSSPYDSCTIYSGGKANLMQIGKVKIVMIYYGVNDTFYIFFFFW